MLFYPQIIVLVLARCSGDVLKLISSRRYPSFWRLHLIRKGAHHRPWPNSRYSKIWVVCEGACTRAYDDTAATDGQRRGSRGAAHGRYRRNKRTMQQQSKAQNHAPSPAQNTSACVCVFAYPVFAWIVACQGCWSTCCFESGPGQMSISCGLNPYFFRSTSLGECAHESLTRAVGIRECRFVHDRLTYNSKQCLCA